MTSSSWTAIDRRLITAEAAIRARLAAPPPKRMPGELAAALGLDLDPWQLDVLAGDWPRALLNCSRQSGKSTVTALLAAAEITTTPGSTVLIVAPSDRQSALLYRSALGFYRRLGGEVPATAETRRSLELANGSQLHALPGKEATIRGYSGVDLLLIDEASRVPDELYQATRPMLATSRGRVVGLSTPAGRRGWWYEAWIDATQDWRRVEVPATACPRIPAAFLAEERRELPARAYEAEYECRFHDADDAYFDADLIDAASSPALEPWDLWRNR